jgi:3-oxo-5-alpha-steroid 4-dehydrogenase 1
VAWTFQESLALVVPLVVLISGGSPNQECLASPANRILLAMFIGHYVYRSLVFPFRMRGGKPMPIGICLLAASFCLFNGYIQARAWTAFEVVLPAAGAAASDHALFAGGVVIWAVGLYVNLHSDHILRTLRKPGETAYKIPYGGAFEYVSGANYFGEIVEWTGYAIASGGRLPAVAFAFFTFANTAPRARHHHMWYLAKFDGYPKQRRAVIPFLW